MTLHPEAHCLSCFPVVPCSTHTWLMFALCRAPDGGPQHMFLLCKKPPKLGYITQ